jgi:hypothetical protein
VEKVDWRTESGRIAEVLRLLGELSGYLASLGGAMTYSRENYASPSGINMPELLRIRGLLLSQPESTGDQRRRTELAGGRAA